PPQRNSPTPPPAPTRSRARLLSPPATRSTQPPPLSLHDALPIFLLWAALRQSRAALLSSVEKLTASEGRLARLLANIPGGVFTRRFIPPGTVEYTFASEGFRKAFGTPAGNFRLDTESLVRLVHPDDRKRMYEAILASCE